LTCVFSENPTSQRGLNVCNHGINMKDKCEKCGREPYNVRI